MSKKSLLIISVIGGICLFLLELFRIKLRYSEIGIEIYSGIVILIEIAIGLWANRKSHKEEKIQPFKALSMDQLARKHDLSNRELEVLNILIQGRSNQEIADELFISLATVKSHVSNILSKTGFARRTQLMSKLNEENSIELKDEIKDSI